MVRKKQQAEGTNGERAAAEECSQTIMEAYRDYTKRSAAKLQQLAAGTKAWWSKSRQLLDMKPRCTAIPALKTSEGSWEFEAGGKANFFQSKYTLIPREDNEYSQIHHIGIQQTKQSFPMEKEAAATFRKLKANSATGPDFLPARILQECCNQLAKPFWRLAIAIINAGEWPRSWMVHWIIRLSNNELCLYQRITVADTSHHRYRKQWSASSASFLRPQSALRYVLTTTNSLTRNDAEPEMLWHSSW